MKNWEGTHQDHQIQLLTLTGHPKTSPCAWEHCPNTPWTLSGLILWPLPWGPCFSSHSPFGWRTFSFRISNLKLPWANFRQFPQILSLVAGVKGSVSASPLPHVRMLKIAVRSPFNFVSSRLSKVSDLTCFSYSFASKPFTLLVALLWVLCNSLIYFLYCGTQNCIQNI